MATGAGAAAMTPTPPRRQVSEPVPDIVIRPPRHRSTLPVPIEPRATPFWSSTAALVTAGVIAAMVLAAVGFYFFHDEIAAKVPPEWRAMLSLRA